MSRPRDTQRQRVYNAERAWYHATPRYETVAEMQAFVDKVTGSKWWQNRYRRTRITVTDGRGRRRGGCQQFYAAARIKMPVWCRYQGYLVHELAHAATPASEPWHGRVFVRNYLLIVKRYLGQESFETLLASFRERGVDWEGSV